MGNNVILDAQKTLIDKIKVVLSDFAKKDVMVFIDSAPEITMPYVKINNIIIGGDDAIMDVLSNVDFVIQITSNKRGNKEVIELAYHLKKYLLQNATLSSFAKIRCSGQSDITVSKSEGCEEWKAEMKISVQC